MTLAFVLALLAGAPTPRVAVDIPMAPGVRPVHARAVAHQVRQAVRAAELEVVDLDNGCRGLDCARVRRCDYYLSTRLRAGAVELEAHITLVDVRSGEVLATSLNVAPLPYGTATLDVPLLVAEVLAALTAPSRMPPEAQAVVEPAEEPMPPVDPAPRVVPVPARRAGFTAPHAEPVPRHGIWAGHCVSHPDLGDVHLDPDDWKRYQRHRRKARNPLPVRRWITEQNAESWGLNLAWIMPPVVLALGLLADSKEVAVLGGGTLPVAAIAAIFDVADVGRVDPCRPTRR